MKVIYYDESILECDEIRFSGEELIADDIYTVPLEEIERIES